MRKIWTQVRYHWRKDRGAYISFGIILLLTACILHLALVLAFQVDRAYDGRFEELNAATVNICVPKEQASRQLEDELRGIEGVTRTESREAVFLESVVQDFRGTDFNMNTVFYNMDEDRQMNELELKETAAETAGTAGIYLPLYVADFGEFEPGDEIRYEMGGRTYAYLVAGVVEEMQYGNYGKGLMGAYLPEEAYRDLAREQPERQVVEYSLMTADGADPKAVKDEAGSMLSGKGIRMLIGCDSVSTKETRTMVCDLLILILLVFAVVVLLVSVCLCRFRISNSIEEEMTGMGVQKALGYTGNMIVGSIVLPYCLVSVAAALMGVLCSYGILPWLSRALSLQSGFSFELSFDPAALVWAAALPTGIVFLFAWGSASRIRRVQPIEAIRGTGGRRRVRKNHFPLEDTLGRIPLLLTAKQMFACGKQNVLLFLVSFVLTVLIAFAGTLFYNVIVKPENFLSTLSEETPDVTIQPGEDRETEVAAALMEEPEVEKVLRYTLGNVTLDGSSVTAFVCGDFRQVRNDLAFLGENPETENEIALGSAFAEKYELGDMIEIKAGDVTRAYRVTGFVQSVNYQGNVCELTEEGYEALLGEGWTPTLYVYLREGADTGAFLEEFEADYGDMLAGTVDSREMQETSREMYGGITAVIVGAVFGLSMLIVLFILYIVIRSLLVRRKQELGIYKAMGYTSGQLMAQTAGSFLPVSVIAVLLSSVLGLAYIPGINQFIFRTVGAMKNNMEVSLAFLMIFALVEILINFAISIGLSLPVRKISAYALIRE